MTDPKFKKGNFSVSLKDKELEILEEISRREMLSKKIDTIRFLIREYAKGNGLIFDSKEKGN